MTTANLDPIWRSVAMPKNIETIIFAFLHKPEYLRSSYPTCWEIWISRWNEVLLKIGDLVLYVRVSTEPTINVNVLWEPISVTFPLQLYQTALEVSLCLEKIVQMKLWIYPRRLSLINHTNMTTNTALFDQQLVYNQSGLQHLQSTQNFRGTTDDQAAVK